jgi:hypothetical protein
MNIRILNYAEELLIILMKVLLLTVLFKRAAVWTSGWKSIQNTLKKKL